MKPARPVYLLRAVDRALDILDCFSFATPVLSATQIARRLKLHKSTVHRFLVNLERRGYLMRLPDGTYRLGLRPFELGGVVLDGFDVRAAARPVLVEMVDRVMETGQLVAYDRGDVIYIDRVECSQSIRMVTAIGKRLPANCTASGKTLLAGAGDAEVERVIAAGLVALTPHTITDPEALRREIAAVRRRGYAVDREEAAPGLAGVAAPIYDHQGVVTAAMSISGPAYRLLPDVDRYVREVQRAAAAVSDALGYRGAASWKPLGAASR